MEQELRLFRGEGPSVWPEDGWKDWKLRLATIVPKLVAQANALISLKMPKSDMLSLSLKWQALLSKKARVRKG